MDVERYSNGFRAGPFNEVVINLKDIIMEIEDVFFTCGNWLSDDSNSRHEWFVELCQNLIVRRFWQVNIRRRLLELYISFEILVIPDVLSHLLNLLATVHHLLALSYLTHLS